MHHNLNEYFAEQLAQTEPASQENINLMITRKTNGSFSKLSPEQLALETEYLQSKVGKTILYYMIVEASTPGVANHIMEIRNVWSDEFDRLDIELHDYYYDPVGETNFPRFIHRTHKQ